MPPARELSGCDDPRREQCPLHVLLVLVTRGGWRTVERDIPALAADQKLVAAHHTSANGVLECFSDHALRSLASIVDGSIDDIDARRDGFQHTGVIHRVVSIGTIAQICSDTE